MFFVTKSYHKEVVENQKNLLEFSLRQHEALVKVLKEQLADLRKLVFVPTSATNIPEEAREVDQVLTGLDSKQVEPDPDQIQREEDARQIDAILSGAYEGFIN